MPEILYREEIGSGDDTERNFPHGIIVTLSFFESDNFRAPSHYLLEAKVMVSRNFIVEQLQPLPGHRTDERAAKMLRYAINRFNQLRDDHPECDPNSGVTIVEDEDDA